MAAWSAFMLDPDFHSLLSTWNFPAGPIRDTVKVHRSPIASHRSPIASPREPDPGGWIMSTDPNRLEHCVERRGAQRFEVGLPLAIRFEERTLHGFAQDLSARGMFFYAETALPEGAVVEITFTMPSEVTLGESMPVRCRGRVLRTL